MARNLGGPVKPYAIARALRKAASKIMDADALLSLDPARLARRAVNRKIARVIHHMTDRFYLRGKH